MRATLGLCLVVLLMGCRDNSKLMPGSGAPEATPEQLASLHAGNQRLATKLQAYAAQTKKLPETLEALKAWANVEKTWEPADDAALVDPWGNPLVLGVITTIGITFTLRSAGPDKKEKTSDDLYYDNRDKATKTFKERNG